MKNKAIFLDRDGTINQDEGFTYKIKNLKFIRNSLTGLKRLQRSDFKLIIVTNQSGIARGFYTKEDYIQFRKEMHKRLNEYRIFIDAEYFCPHHPENGYKGGIKKLKIDCNCRKPKIGMLEQAANDFNLDLNQSWMIGDKKSDILAGKNAGCRTIQVLTGYEKDSIKYADFIAEDLIEAADYILNYKNK